MTERDPAVATQAVGIVKRAFTSGRALRRAMNLWPPFLFAGIRVEEVTADFRRIRVRLRRSRLTSNYVGSQFGGSLFAMTDPFWMLMLLRNLNAATPGDPQYVVWDRAAEISFLRPARSGVTTTFELTEQAVAEIRAAASGGAKVLRWFTNDLVDDEGNMVARTRKQVYVRQRR